MTTGPSPRRERQADVDTLGGATEPEPGDRELVNGVLAGDERAFRLLYRRHTPRLRMLATRLLGGPGSDVDDVVQETWIRACRALPAFRWESGLHTWLHAIAVRSSHNFLRGRTRHETVELPATLGGRPADIESRLDLDRAISLLPDRQRLVVVLHDVEGHRHSDIARQLDIAVGTSRSDLSRARTRLRALLSN